jgi:hypothetical protein
VPAISASTTSLALADVDGDGDLDLVVGNYGSAQNRVYLNNGSGTFADFTATQFPMIGDSTSSVTLGDVDGDGDLDLVVGNWGRNRLYLNLHRQLDVPHILRTGYPFTLDVYARCGPPRLFDVALTWLSLGTARVPLPPLGRLGIDPATAAPLPPVLVPQPAGMASITLNVPNTPALVGVTIHAQTVLVQPPLQPRFTNVVSETVVRL